MEKPRQKKIKSMEKKYSAMPAPYSRSWTEPPKSKKSGAAKKNPNKSSNAFNNKRNCLCRRLEPPIFHGPDPTVPHLKYGLFPAKASRNQALVTSSKQKQQTQNLNETKKEQNKKKLESPIIQAKIVKAINNAPKDSPKLMFRALNPRDVRCLAMSASTHLDIKPRLLAPALH